MRLGESFGADFELPADGFCFLRWRSPLGPPLWRIAPGGIVSVLGPPVSLVAI
jgi:hypothetical protein